MIQICIEPMDTLFFRDHRPFTAGEDTFAEFTFPSPLTFFGAVGSAVLDSTGGAELDKFVRGNYEHPKLGKYDANLKDTRMKLKGPFLHKENEIFFPPPANLWIVRGNNSIPHTSLPNSETDPKWKSKENHQHLMPLKVPEEEQMEPLNEYISIKYLTQYLSNNLPPTITVKSEEEFFVREDRYGHVLSNDSLTVKEGYLYTTTHLRFKDKLEHKTHIKTGFTLIAEGIDETDIPDKTIALGGERRRAMVSISRKDDFIPNQPEVLKKIQSTKKFFIYLATPAIFRNGWYRDFSLEFDGAVMVGAAVNKPLYISGWESYIGKPRPIKKAVPAGSVYFFKAESWKSEQFEEFYKKYHFKESLSDEYPSAGFGIGLIGSW
ncbi:MAG: type III-B CRISPR module-associated protein Cmr3 [Methanosarcinales archaeon]|uniref:Type III-B CRISPR module-associated protein Cmr3 n=1 Tax=Candidatus Ethanoperedens thermophilum TaxID=2766897 RepID=A0A848D9N0_9EURY|nr:type III-B CRISPR module-associated protein Cmr3 [Candidatus Ethanoperedens thermophilum]